MFDGVEARAQIEEDVRAMLRELLSRGLVVEVGEQ